MRIIQQLLKIYLKLGYDMTYIKSSSFIKKIKIFVYFTRRESSSCEA